MIKPPGAASACYFIVDDGAKVDLLFGDPDTAIGTEIASVPFFGKSPGRRTINTLLAKVPTGDRCYRTYLLRTDGRTGKEILQDGVCGWSCDGRVA